MNETTTHETITPAASEAIIDLLVEFGDMHLVGKEATKENVAAIRRVAKTRDIRFRSSSGRTLHGTKVITLALVD